MPEPRETEVLAILLDLFTSKTTLVQRLALLKLTTKLTRMLGGCGASLHETRSCSVVQLRHTEVSSLMVAGRPAGRKSMNQEVPSMQHHLYPADWRNRAQACLERAGYRCEDCGMRHGSLRVGKHRYNLYFVQLHAAHVNHDPGNPQAELRALCPTCHMKYDRRTESTPPGHYFPRRR